MSAVDDEVELSKKHEEILSRRTELLAQMETRHEQQKSKRKQQLMESQAAQERNARLLEDFQKIEERLRKRQLPDPDMLALETRYWASVEEQIPEWKLFLLGRGPHPTDAPDQPPRKPKQRSSTARNQSLPPRPKPRPAK
ncbi:centrosomal protein 15 [Polymixia lowei]